MLKRALALAIAWAGLAGMQAPAPPAELEMWRLDCGEVFVSPLDSFSDTYLYEGQEKQLVASCYLIRHGERYLLWDAGLPGELAGNSHGDGPYRLSLRARLTDQLARIGVRPEQVTFLGISHYHDDHIGQAADFGSATLLIGAEDWEAVRTRRPETAARFRPWIEGGGRVEAVARDHDVFGDGTVVMLYTPGHTPGHHALLVRLRGRGPILLTGDLYHFTEQLRDGGMASWNTSRADTLASRDRLTAIARSLNATLIIQHEPADIARLPLFPEAAR